MPRTASKAIRSALPIQMTVSTTFGAPEHTGPNSNTVSFSTPPIPRGYDLDMAKVFAEVGSEVSSSEQRRDTSTDPSPPVRNDLRMELFARLRSRLAGIAQAAEALLSRSTIWPQGESGEREAKLFEAGLLGSSNS